MLRELGIMIAITLLPISELRGGIAYGFLELGVDNLFLVAVVCVLVNIFLGIILYFFMDYIIVLLRRVDFFDRFYNRYLIRLQKKSHRVIHKYGVLGLALFIAIPLPGSGVYSGTIVSKIFDFTFREYMFALIIGVVGAATIVSVAMFSGNSIFMHMIL